MEEYITVGRIFEWSSMGKRSRGHQRNRWQDEDMKDSKVLGVKNCRQVVINRSSWHDLVVKLKICRGM
jgi:hypothetical protein